MATKATDIERWITKLRDAVRNISPDDRLGLWISDKHVQLVWIKEGVKSVELDEIETTIDRLRKICEELASSKTTSDQTAQIELIYQAYPRKRDPRASKQAIKRALNDNDIPVMKEARAVWLLTMTKKFAALCKKRGTEMKFIPHPSTWFNRQSYLNEIESRK